MNKFEPRTFRAFLFLPSIVGDGDSLINGPKLLSFYFGWMDGFALETYSPTPVLFPGLKLSPRPWGWLTSAKILRENVRLESILCKFGAHSPGRTLPINYG